MNPEPKSGLTQLTGSLKARLDLIIQTVPQFWESCPHYPHFTSSSLTHSERTHRLLAQLAQELPLTSQLTADEVFIVSAAAYLYEIGMQTSKLLPVLDYDCPPGIQPTPQQLLEIRQNKHLLSQKLIFESVSNNYQGISLGLSADEYTNLIAEVCRWISDEPLKEVPEMLPVHGVPIRVRLLVALLRLADQLYIDSSRVSLDLLERADLSPRQHARWWAYHYTSTLPIEKGQIRFHYFVPFAQREYLGHVRALIEPDFEFDNNPTMHWLLEEYSLRLIPPHNPSLGRYDQSTGFQRAMSDEMITFLREEVRSPIPTASVFQPEPVVGDTGTCLLVLDYENFIIQLGLEGYILTPEQVSSYIAQLRGHAINEHDGTIDGLAIGHWNRGDLVESAKMLDKMVYSLITVEDGEDPAEKLSAELREKARGQQPPKRTILVAPRAEMARTILHLKQKQQTVSTWVTNTSDTEIFNKGSFGNKYSFLGRLLKLGTPQPLSPEDFDTCEAACILRLQGEIGNSKSGSPLNKISESLDKIERLSGQVIWWRSWLFHKGILIGISNRSDSFQLNNDHSSVAKYTKMRTSVIETLSAISPKGQGAPQDKLLKELRVREPNFFRQDTATMSFLELLKEEELIRRDLNSLGGTQPLWQLNTDHVDYLALDPEHYLAPFAVAFDHIALRDEHFKLHEHSLLRLVSPYVGERAAEAVYALAQKEGWVRRKETDERLHRGEGNLVIIGLNESNPSVGRALRNRNILVNYLNGPKAKDGLDRDILWKRLNAIQSFSLDDVEFNLLMDIFERDRIVSITHNVADPLKDNIVIDRQTPLTQKLIGRMHLYGLIRTLRQLRATSPERKRAFQEVMDPLKRYVTNNNEDMARWTLSYAHNIGLIETPEGKGKSAGSFSHLWLARHPFVGRLDNREGSTCQHLVDMVRDLSRSYRDGWVPQPLIYTEMDKTLQFGYSREEQEYWMDQAIYRLRLLEVEKRKDSTSGHNISYFVRAAQR